MICHKRLAVLKSRNLKLFRLFRLAEDLFHLAIRLKIQDTISFVKKTFRQNLDTSELKEIQKKQEHLKPVQNPDFFISLMTISNRKKKSFLRYDWCI